MVLTPVQLLLLIVGIEVISVPLIIFTVNAIMIGYFRAKEQHQARMIGSTGKVFEHIGKGIIDTIKSKEEDNNNDAEADS